MRFQTEVGIPFDPDGPEAWCMDSVVYDVVWSWEGQAVRWAMIGIEVKTDFLSQFEDLLVELDHLTRTHAQRVAFNHLIDARWDEIKREALGWFQGALEDRTGQ